MIEMLKSLKISDSDLKLLSLNICPDLEGARRLAYLFHIEEPIHVPALFGQTVEHSSKVEPDPVRGARLLAVWLAACRYVGSSMPETNIDETDSSSMQARASLILLGQICLSKDHFHPGLTQFSRVYWFEEALKNAIFEYGSFFTLKPILPGTTIDSMVFETGPLRMRAEATIQSVPNSESMDQFRTVETIEITSKGKSFIDKKALQSIFQLCYENANQSIFAHPLPVLYKRFTISGSQEEWSKLAPFPRRLKKDKPTRVPIFAHLLGRRS